MEELMRFTRSATAFAAVFALSIGAGTGAAQAADPVKLRMGWVVAGADAPLQIFGKQGVATHEGVSYALEPIKFAGTPPMVTALAAGEIDLVPFAYSTFALSIQNAKMEDLRIISDVFQDGVPGHYTNEFMVLKDSPIKTVEDLKGKVLAVNAAGSALDMALRAMLGKHNMQDKKDVTIIEAGFPNMRALLAEHKADLISAVRPFSADPQLRSISRTLFTQRDAIGPSQMIILTAKQAFLQKNRAAITDFIEDNLRLVKWYSDPANHDEVIKLVSTYTKTPPELWASWLFTAEGDFYRDPKGLPNLDALQNNLKQQKELGFLKGDIDVKKYADLSLAQEAAARVK
jgi:sulfonate transport system substrate-binding protein